MLPVYKETYYSNIKEKKVKKNQDGTVLVIKLNDIKKTFKVIRKTFIKFYL